MTEQEQIDGLKRVVAVQGAEIANLQRALGMMAQSLSEPPMLPTCGKCGATMYDGFTCGQPASICPMGVGVIAR